MVHERGLASPRVEDAEGHGEFVHHRFQIDSRLKRVPVPSGVGNYGCGLGGEHGRHAFIFLGKFRCALLVHKEKTADALILVENGRPQQSFYLPVALEQSQRIGADRRIIQPDRISCDVGADKQFPFLS